MAGKSLLHVIIFERPLLPLFLGQIPDHLPMGPHPSYDLLIDILPAPKN
jgi:hypothetical protein